MLITAIILIIRAMFKLPDDQVGEMHSKLRRGWTFMILALCLGGATVTFFGKMLPIFLFYIGVGAALVELGPKTPAEAAANAGKSKHKTVRKTVV